MPSSLAPNRLEIETMNGVLGGTFTSRINMNLREDKHWSYGARSSLPDALGQRPWLLSAPVQTDKTVDAMREIQREIGEFVGSRPATAEEIAKIRNSDVRALSGRLRDECGGERRHRRDDHLRLAGRLRADAEVPHRGADRRRRARCGARDAATRRPLTWVVIGDLGQDRAADPRPEARRGAGARRRRQRRALIQLTPGRRRRMNRLDRAAGSRIVSTQDQSTRLPVTSSARALTGCRATPEGPVPAAAPTVSPVPGSAPLVERPRLLRDLRALVRRLDYRTARERRHRRLPGPDREARLPERRRPRDDDATSASPGSGSCRSTRRRATTATT